MEGIWSLVTIVGPVLLIGAIIWAYLLNRTGSQRDIERAERGARKLRAELAEEEARRGAP